MCFRRYPVTPKTQTTAKPKQLLHVAPFLSGSMFPFTSYYLLCDPFFCFVSPGFVLGFYPASVPFPDACLVFSRKRTRSAQLPRPGRRWVSLRSFVRTGQLGYNRRAPDALFSPLIWPRTLAFLFLGSVVGTHLPLLWWVACQSPFVHADQPTRLSLRCSRWCR